MNFAAPEVLGEDSAVPCAGLDETNTAQAVDPVVTKQLPYLSDDAMGRLWVPHRMMYIQGEDKPATPKSDDCPFCDPVIRGDDLSALREKLVVARGRYCFVILNLFPYNSGHMLVLPYRHVAGYVEMNESEAAEFYLLSKRAVIAAERAMNPQGFNLGINQGSIAGAGIAAHLHQHVVPRWTGDANFLPIIGQTKAMPQFLGDTRTQLANDWPTDLIDGFEPVI